MVQGRAEMAGNTGKEKMEAWTRLNAEIVALEEEVEEWRQEEGPQRMMTNEGVTEGDEENEGGSVMKDAEGMVGEDNRGETEVEVDGETGKGGDDDNKDGVRTKMTGVDDDERMAGAGVLDDDGGGDEVRPKMTGRMMTEKE